MTASKRRFFATVNDNIRKLDSMSRLNRNVVAKTGESLEHFLKKAEIAYKLMDMGHEITTEAKFLNGSGRADIFVLDTGHVYEIMKSEEMGSIEEKREKYPVNPDKIIAIKI